MYIVEKTNGIRHQFQDDHVRVSSLNTWMRNKHGHFKLSISNSCPGIDTFTKYQISKCLLIHKPKENNAFKNLINVFNLWKPLFNPLIDSRQIILTFILLYNSLAHFAPVLFYKHIFLPHMKSDFAKRWSKAIQKLHNTVHKI